ncbi:MAG: PorT family protein [Bacteroidota bacterium]|nr:PorT family protein [Bacteroidota bacterium]
MKNLLFLPLIILVLPVFAQNNEIKAVPKPVYDRFILDLTIDNWLNVPNGVKTRIWSPGFSVSVFNDIKFRESAFGFAFGLGLSSHNVHHNGIFVETLETDTSSAFTSLIPRTTPYKKNKLSANYIELPFEFRIRTNGKNPFRFYPGVKVGYLFNIHKKVIDDTGKWKFYTFPNANPLRYVATARLGYGKINLTGSYGLNSIFRNNKGVELIPFSVGISLMM